MAEAVLQSWSRPFFQVWLPDFRNVLIGTRRGMECALFLDFTGAFASMQHLRDKNEYTASPTWTQRTLWGSVLWWYTKSLVSLFKTTASDLPKKEQSLNQDLAGPLGG